MKHLFFKFLKYAVLLGAAILSANIFWPRHYDVPELHQRDGTQYWDLPTGSRIAYTLVSAKGPKKSSPIIFLHGGPGGLVSDRWIKTLSVMSEDGYDVYLYDQIGGGFSGRLEDIEAYTADRHKRDLEAIVQTIGAEKVVLIGQSWGCILATLFAADHPDQLEKIIFSCPGSILPSRPELRSVVPPDSLHLREPHFTNAQGNTKANNWRTRSTAFLAKTFGLKLASDREADEFATFLSGELNKSLVCDPAKAPAASGGGGYYVHVMTMNSLDQIQDPRSKLTLAPYPVLVLKGQCDNQKWGFTKEYVDVFPHSQLVVVPDAGHAILVEQPELYIQALREFLSQ